MPHQHGNTQQQADEQQLRQVAERLGHAQQGQADGAQRQHAVERPPGEYAQAAQACRGLMLEGTGAVARRHLLQAVDQQATAVAHHLPCAAQLRTHGPPGTAGRTRLAWCRLAPDQQPQALDQQAQRVTQARALARQLRVQALTLGQQGLPGGRLQAQEQERQPHTEGKQPGDWLPRAACAEPGVGRQGAQGHGWRLVRQRTARLCTSRQARLCGA
ncbi:hypothetical protein D9M71_287700 [compost metagenome]